MCHQLAQKSIGEGTSLRLLPLLGAPTAPSRDPLSNVASRLLVSLLAQTGLRISEGLGLR